MGAVDAEAAELSKLDRNRSAALKNMDEFNNTLQDWSKMIRDQVEVMSHCFTAIKGFSDTIPAMLDSMQPAAEEPRIGNGYAHQTGRGDEVHNGYSSGSLSGSVQPPASGGEASAASSLSAVGVCSDGVRV